MRHLSRVWAVKRQSELSLAVSAMFFSGAVFAGLGASVFPPETRPPIWAPISAAGLVLFLGLLVLWRGRRLRHSSAAVLSGLYLALLLFLIATTTSLTRATIAAMLTVVVIVFYTWFLPSKYARLVGYSCIVILGLILVIRYPSSDAYLTTVALVFLTVLLTEVFGRFKVNLERAALTDHLCRVWNRRGFEILLDQEIKSVSRTHEPLALMYLDLDGFKAVNDHKGHVEGDRVLQRVSEGLLSGVRSCDNVARLGGDEFVLLLPRTTAEGAQRIGERLRAEVNVFEWSFGVAEYRSGESIIEFIRRSDDEMREQKRVRGGRSGPVSR